MPADNLFITDYKNGRNNLDKVSFKNLIGRIGRIDHNLFGNVFMVCLSNSDEQTIEKYADLLKNEIPNQSLSIEETITKIKKLIQGLVIMTLNEIKHDKPQITSLISMKGSINLYYLRNNRKSYR